MPFHFKKAEPPAQAVRRVCREHLGAAQARLRKSRHPAAVHGVRKELKKLRALFRLVRGEIGRGAYRRAAKGLRRVAGRLAATRDARVRFQAFAQVAGPAAAKRFPMLQKALQKDCQKASRRLRAKHSLASAGRILRKINKRLGRLKINASGWRAIAPGLQQSYRRGQQAGIRSRREPSPEHLHAWRKQVKIFWHQLRLVCPQWPASVRGQLKQLDRLGALLGDEHDLALLKQFVAQQGQLAEAARLNPLIEARQKKLRAAALQLGAALYAPAPATVVEQLGKDWRAWHGRDRKK